MYYRLGTNFEKLEDRLTFDAGGIEICPLPELAIEPPYSTNLWHNLNNPLNVDGDEQELVSPIDAIQVINWINSKDGTRPLAEESNSLIDSFIDVNDDGYCSAIDAVLIINYLNQPKFGVPILHSNPDSPHKLFLDFDGGIADWSNFGFQNTVYAPYNFEGSSDDFSEDERKAIGTIFSYVAEDYAPFDIDVTTQDPGNLRNQETAHIAIGGSWKDWFKIPAGGVAQLNGYLNDNSNTAFVFSKNLGSSNAKIIADAVSHEAGHLFSLRHQSRFENGVLVEEYHSGNGDWAPIMGVGYNRTVTTWYNGVYMSSFDFEERQWIPALQDDMDILSKPWLLPEPDDYPNIYPVDNNFELFGVINSHTDKDQFSFRLGIPGTAQLYLEKVPFFGYNSKLKLKLLDSGDNLIKETSYDFEQPVGFSADLVEGDYIIEVSNNGEYGKVGEYQLIGVI